MTFLPDSFAEHCVAQCRACIEVCGELARRWCDEPRSLDLISRIGRLLDCTEACEIAIACLVHRSALRDEICAMCGEVCEECAEHLEHFAGATACADLCRRCADACFNLWRIGNGVALGDRESSALPGAAPLARLREACSS
jgi:hypothetical protein